ncbi:MAG: FHA domain-containing protein [Gemmataceae bacterium]|nr:FHA domain-containing protein [Gemmataceae bacterium]
MKFCLMVGQGPHKGRLIPISLPQFVIGRDSKCHLRPASQTISKRHCELLMRDEKCFVRDLSSTNGTFVNEVQVQGERELFDGDVLKIGPLDFNVKIDGQAEKPTQVEKETQVPEPEQHHAAHHGPLDEDSIGSMLLEMTEEEKAQATSEELEGSTIMDMAKAQAEEPQATKPAPYRPAAAKPSSNANTSSAAKEILEKYRRRPRT